MTNLSQQDLARLVAEVVKALHDNGSAPKAASISQPVDKLALKDKALIAGFVRRGIKREDIKLMDRSNPAAEYNIKPFRAWLELGWQVRRGEKSVKGLFHQSQCDRIAPAKPSPAKGKAKGKPQLVA